MAIAHPVGRRGAAHQPDDGARHVAHQHAVRARRTLHRTAPARHAARHRGDAAAARQRQLAAGGRARPADHARRGPHHRPRAGAGRARRAGGVQRHAGRARGGRGHPDGRLPLGSQGRGAGRRASWAAAARRSAAGGARRHGAQPAGPRRGDPARTAGVCHRRVRFRQVHARAGRAVRGPAAGQGQADGDARGPPRAARCRARERGGDGRPDRDRSHHALQPGQLRRRVRRDPQALRRRGGFARARLHGGYVQLQLRERALPDLLGQRLRARRDAVPLRRVPALPRLRREPLPPGDPRGEARARRGPGEEHRRRAADDRLRGRGILRRRP